MSLHLRELTADDDEAAWHLRQASASNAVGTSTLSTWFQPATPTRPATTSVRATSTTWPPAGS